jgi:hypothetical protein
MLEAGACIFQLEMMAEGAKEDSRLVTVALRNEVEEMVGETYLDIDDGNYAEEPCMALSLACYCCEVFETILLVRPSSQDPSKWVRYVSEK